ncbi:MAG: hypothetical protein V3U71_01215 [Cocleimonas sp.]
MKPKPHLENEMDSSNKQNTSYVFSQETLDQAIEQWINEKTANSKEKEPYLIAKAALPWFMQHLNQLNASVYMFTYGDMAKELASWKSEQLAEFPHQQARIEKTCDLLTKFFVSDIIFEFKMVVTLSNS